MNNKCDRKMLKILEKYKKQSDIFTAEYYRLSSWKETLPIGQYPPTYDRASLKQAYFKHKNIFPLWEKIRSRLDITQSKKTLWQLNPHVTEHEPPLYNEIKPLLKKECKI